MQVTVRVTGIFREWLGAPEAQVEVPAGATLRDLVAALAARSPRLAQRVGPFLERGGDLSDLLLAVADDRVLRGGEALAEGARVSLFPPLEGGARTGGAAGRRRRARGGGGERTGGQMGEKQKRRAKVMRVEEAFWEQPPAHFQAFSKMLVHPTTADTRFFDFRISSYQPKGYAEVHVHEVAENVYYILRGKGLVELDGVRHLVEPHTVIYIPPGVRHGIFNTGLEDLVFLVAASPPHDMPEVRQTGGRET